MTQPRLRIRGTTTAGGIGGRSSARQKIKIKPFAKPPSLPDDFYDTTRTTLLNATRAILRNQPLYATPKTGSATKPQPPQSPKSVLLGSSTSSAPSNTSSLLPDMKMGTISSSDHQHEPPTQRKQPQLVGREELYRSVEDLCVHKFGPRLHKDVIVAVYDAAEECLSRLVLNDGSSQSSSFSCELSGSTRVDWRHKTTLENSKGAGPMEIDDVCSDSEVTSTSSIGSAPLPKYIISIPNTLHTHTASDILTTIQKLYSSYTSYLHFIRSIFLYLDRSLAIQNNRQQQQQQQTNNVCATTSTKSLVDVGISAFRRTITLGNISDTVISCIILLVRNHRDDRTGVDIPLLRNSVRMLGDLGLFRSHFVPILLETTCLYYEMEGKYKISSIDLPNFLLGVEHRMEDERERLNLYLECSDTSITNSNQLSGNTSSSHNVRKALLQCVERNLLVPHVSHILSMNQIYPLFSHSKQQTAQNQENGSSTNHAESLRRLYSLLSRIDYQKYIAQDLRSVFSQYVQSRGVTIINSCSNDKDIIPALLSFYEDVASIISFSFRNDELFQNTHKTSVEHYLNTAEMKIVELLARYVDILLREKTLSNIAVGAAAGGRMITAPPSDSFGNNRSPVTSMENKLSAVIIQFRLLHPKDAFETWYKQLLSKRLLQNKSSSIDFERSFLAKLKAECGAAYTSKLEGMFKDMDLSTDILGQYNDYCSGDRKATTISGSVPMDVTILTTGWWPQFAQYPNFINYLPPVILDHVNRFEKYYDTKYQGRKLSWQYSLCNVCIKADFGIVDRNKEFLVTLYQALVLLAFNPPEVETVDVDSADMNLINRGDDCIYLTLPIIMQKTGITSREELERVLQSFIFGKARLMLRKKTSKKDPKLRSIEDDDLICIDHSFKNKQIRIKIPQIQSKEIVKAEKDKNVATLDKDRQQILDAIIVRIMKARKTCQHKDLMVEIMNQVKHTSHVPTNASVKNRIESLIEREYVERNGNERDIYNYLA